MSAAEQVIDLARYWCWTGAAVAAVFLTIGIDRIDEDARGAYAFRPLLIPAVLLIWPLILWRWWRIESGTEQWQHRYAPPRASHTVAAVALAVVVVITLASAIAVRQTWPAEAEPVRLSSSEDGG